MPLQPNIVPVNFSQGVDTKTDPKQVVAGKLISLQNGYFQTPKMIRKRNGYGLLPQTVFTNDDAITGGVALSSLSNELVQLDGLSAYTFSSEAQKWHQIVGRYYPVSVSTMSVARSSLTQNEVDGAHHAGTGLELYAYVDGLIGLAVTVIDSATGAIVLTATSVASQGVSPKVIVNGSNFFILYVNTNDGKLYRATVSVTNPTVIVTSAFVTNLNATHQVFDATLINGLIYVAYANNTPGLSVGTMSSGGVWSGDTQFNTDSPTSCVSIWGDTSFNAWISYYDGANIKAITLTSALAVLIPLATAATTANVSRIAGIFQLGSSPIQSTIFYETSAAATYNYFLSKVYFAAAGSSGNGRVLRSVGFGGKPFVYNGGYYLTALYSSTLQPTYFLLNVTTAVTGIGPTSVGLVVARINSLSAGGFPGNVPEANSVGSGIFMLPTLMVDRAGLIGGGATPVQTMLTGIQSTKVTFGTTPTSLVNANSLHYSGGKLGLYDSTQIVEHGFHVFPESVTATPSGAGGSITGPGSMQYIAVYEWTDGKGNVHQSAPSVATSVTIGAGGTNSVTLAIPTLRITDKGAFNLYSSAGIAIYRTQLNGTTFFRVNAVGSYLQNSLTADTVAYVDTQPDSTIGQQDLLYTTGGVVENICVPATLTMCNYKNRVILIPSETPTQWWYSQEVAPGLPVEFSNLFVQNETGTDGGFTACKQMDDKLILTKTNTVFYTVGNGPSPNGTGNDFQPAQQIVTETGCNNAASMVLIPDGLIYQSPKGIYLLSRSLKDFYIGADVEAYNSFTITSAKVIPNTTQVRFTLSNGTVLMYDWFVKDQSGIGQWSVWTNISAVDSAVFQGNFTYLKANGQVMQETPGTFTDNGSFIQLGLTTSWLSLTGLQGFQRIWKILILGDYKSPHTLQTQLAYDFDPTIVQTDNIVATSTPPYQWRIMPSRQKCESIQLTLQDVQSSSFGEGLDLSAITLEVGSIGGVQRVPAAKSYG